LIAGAKYRGELQFTNVEDAVAAAW
jgi:hypothetical protein